MPGLRHARPRRPPRAAEPALDRLAALRGDRGPRAARAKREAIARLDETRLRRPEEVAALHDLLLFFRALPEDARIVAASERALARFARRPDVLRLGDELAGSGIEGTAIPYPFFYPTALWLARRFPGRLAIDWEHFDDPDEMAPLVAAIVAPEERAWLAASAPGARAALAALAGRRRTDAEELLERLAALPGDDFTRESLHDATQPWYVLAPGANGPSRTRGRAPGSPLVYRAQPLDRRRPDLAAEWRRPPAQARRLSPGTARPLLDLAREAMATRARDLDAFAYGDPRDAWRVRDAEGLEFVAFGSLPERRLPLATVYGLLTLRNGVPAGYAQIDGFLSTALVHFNTFETFRGADAAWVFARLLATTRALLGARAFAIEPYQLGRDNVEAIESGAWWFYAKLGFAPRDAAIARRAASERRRFARDPRARSSPGTLRLLAERHLFWEPDGRPATLPPHAEIARASVAVVAERAGAALAAGRRALVGEAAELVALGGETRLSAAERFWLERWAPMIHALPGLASWSIEDRRGLGELLRAKAGRHESDLLPLARAHPRFGPTLLELARRTSAADAPALSPSAGRRRSPE
jgi:hypothetical protein